MTTGNPFKDADAFMLRQHQHLSDKTTAWWDLDCLVLARAATLFFMIGLPFVMLSVTFVDYPWLSLVLLLMGWEPWVDCLNRLRLIRKRMAEKERVERDGGLMSVPSVPGSNIFIRLLYFVGGIVALPSYVYFLLFGHSTFELNIVAMSWVIAMVMFACLSSADWFLFCIPRSRPPSRSASKIPQGVMSIG